MNAARKRPTRTRRLAMLLLKFAFSAVLTLVLAEVALRLIGMKPVTAAAARDPRDLHSDPSIAEAQRRGWIPWPHTVQQIKPLAEHPRGFVEMRRNGASCREDDETPIAKPDDLFRIVVLGDSHTDGICFNEESFANRLEAELNDRRPAGMTRRFDVINAGFAQSSPYQQWWAYDQVYRRFQPDHVVMVFYAGNDLLELLRRDDRVHLEPDGSAWKHSAPLGGGDTTQAQATWRESLRNLVRDHSASYHLLTKIAPLRRLVRGAARDAYRDRLDAAEQRSSAVVWQGFNQAYYFAHHPDDWRQAAEMQREVLELIRARCDEDQVGFTLAVLPTFHEIHPEPDRAAFDDVARILELEADDLDCDRRAGQLVMTLAGELNLDVLDLRVDFATLHERDPQRRLYYQFDHHLNPVGHARVATQLLEKIGPKLLAPGS